MLREYFHSLALNMLYENYPSVFFDDELELRRKILFLMREMHVSPEDIAESAALEHDLEEFIKPRYAGYHALINVSRHTDEMSRETVTSVPGTTS